MQTAVDIITLSIAVAGGLIVVYGVIVGLVEFVQFVFHKFGNANEKADSFETIRLDIGRHLLLGLEFLIAADIIRTVVGPTLEELAILGGIVTIRTVLSYFLGKELGRQKPK